jgi:lysophospholipase L1-like esterase
VTEPEPTSASLLPRSAAAPHLLVVLSDSLAVTAIDEHGRASRTNLYPQRVASGLTESSGERWEVKVVGAAGLTVPAMLRWVQTSERVRARIASSSAVLLGVGSLDASTAGFPLAFNDRLRRSLPRPLKRALGVAFVALNPMLIKLRGERSPQTSRRRFRATWVELVELCRSLAPEVPIFATLPALHRARQGAASTRHHGDAVADLRELAAQLDVILIDVPKAQQPNMDLLAPDGMHWTRGMHAVVAKEILAVMQPVLSQARH